MAKDRVSLRDKSLPEFGKRKSGKDYIDIDQTILEPSPQRIRNILTLEERVAAIEAYDCRPMYTKVAKMFNCSWEQIKNIIANRDAIMEFYEATRTIEAQNDPNRLEVRSRKIRFLGECLYEYIQRAQFHTKANITEELLRMKAFEFRDIIQIDNFMPNKAWINHFKATYNFSLSNRQITITRTPPTSLDLKDIMTYCTKTKTKNDTLIQAPPAENRETTELYRTTTRIAVSGENEAALQEIKERRRRKINFLMRALFEYTNRVKYHHKKRMNEVSLRKVAFELKEMLKIDNFYPDKEWLNHYITVTYPTMLEEYPETRPPPLSLDLKDILSYCSRQENKKQAPSTITLAPKELALSPLTVMTAPTQPQRTPADITPLVQIHTFNLRRSDETTTTRTEHAPNVAKQSFVVPMLAPKIKQEIIDLDKDEGEGVEEQDVKPNVRELLPQQQPQKSPTEQPKPIEIKTKTQNAAAPITKSSMEKVASQHEEPRKPANAVPAVAPALRLVSISALVPPLSQLPTATQVTATTTTALSAIVSTIARTAVTTTALSTTVSTTATAATTTTNSKSQKRPSSESPFPHQPLKIQKIESIGVQVEQTVHSPGHWSEHSDQDEEDLPKHVTNYKDALKLLKPLEEFAMLEENYRVIGLISQLEEIFKHPPPREDTD